MGLLKIQWIPGIEGTLTVGGVNQSLAEGVAVGPGLRKPWQKFLVIPPLPFPSPPRPSRSATSGEEGKILWAVSPRVGPRRQREAIPPRAGMRHRFQGATRGTRAARDFFARLRLALKRRARGVAGVMVAQ